MKYFGILLIAIGVLILILLEDLPKSEIFQKKRPILIIFGAIIVLSGICCLLLEKDWFIYFEFY